MRADRLLSLLLLLQNRGLMTAAGLAAELEVSVRTVYRDVEAGRGGGRRRAAPRGAPGGAAPGVGGAPPPARAGGGAGGR
ncbi:HTH domain-containing protein, partial [Streptomyces prasinus]